ncbi:glutamine amidotransferase [Sediminispirochaeta bajacaliforniensis]|uniref:glutamine amidotransferase n=1 Tax=Sediminispirochaeta bajacaliforniensis TaxID=148 RepID=UPI00037A8198|nr:glutamine amidotransferase [Sediminispirochaeta bajacaliforniensis]
MQRKKILLAGESWSSQTTHVKGFNSFSSSVYETGERWLKKALEESGYDVFFLPNHLVSEEFPFTMGELKKYDAIILSDVGSDTLLITQETFNNSHRQPNRCELIKEYVLEGASLLMVGGYLTFSGVDAKGRWGMTPIQDILPVEILQFDDRMEHPEGVKPKVIHQHDVLKGVPAEWPFFLGYNKTIPMDDAVVPVTICDDPLIALCQRGKGRCGIFSSDCAPHWGPPEFLSWAGYQPMWGGLMDWLTDV